MATRGMGQAPRPPGRGHEHPVLPAAPRVGPAWDAGRAAGRKDAGPHEPRRQRSGTTERLTDDRKTIKRKENVVRRTARRPLRHMAVGLLATLLAAGTTLAQA